MDKMKNLWNRLSISILMVGLLCFSFAGLGIAQETDGKKVLFIDSYHEGYPWSDGITNGVVSVLEDNNITFKIHRMDTKRNRGTENFEKAALVAKELIETYQPDVVIATDDNASKYLIVPYFKDADLPFVFAGVNWDAAQYGYPFKNVTGMVEVNAVNELLELISQMTDGGERLGVLTTTVPTGYQETNYIKKIFGLEFVQEIYVITFEDWKQAYADLQDQVDILLIGNNAGIPEWDHENAKDFVLEHAKIPSGTVYEHIAPYAMIGYTKVPEEQGEWAAKTALKIMAGTSPSDIPITKNEKGNLYVNTRIADKLKIKIPTDILEVAKILE